MLWRLVIYIHKDTNERAHIVHHQKNENYVLRYLDQQKIETVTESEFSINWRHEGVENEQIVEML